MTLPTSVFPSACRHALALTLALSMAASFRSEAQAKPTASGDQASALAVLEQKMEALAKNYAMLACSVEFEQTLTALRQDCAQALGSSQTEQAGGAPEPTPMACPANVVQQALETEEGQLKFSFAQALQGMRHALVPIQKGKVPADDLSWLHPNRHERLRQILAVPFIDSTKLLLVTSDSAGPPTAAQRLDLVRSYLRNYAKLPHADRHIDRPLKLLVAASKDKLRYSFDHPLFGEGKDLGLWVWIFRIDC